MLQIAVCDDEAEDLCKMQELIRDVMERFSLRCNIQAFETGEELLDSPVSFDLIFMDIRLAGENGIEIGKKLYWKNRNAKIIFQTYLREECGNAVNQSHAFAFLTKPVERDLLEKQMEEFLRTREDLQDMWVSFPDARWIFPEDKEKKQVVRMPVRDIVYFESIKRERLLKIVTEKGIFLYPGIFGELEERMRPFGFETCSRGIMVNFDKIRKMGKRELILQNGDCLPFSQRRSVVFKERMGEFFYNPVKR